MTATDGANLRDKVRIAYSAAAEKPEEKHAFPVGRGFAESLGYPAFARPIARHRLGSFCGSLECVCIG
jgi:hypothetical protein